MSLQFFPLTPLDFGFVSILLSPAWSTSYCFPRLNYHHTLLSALFGFQLLPTSIPSTPQCQNNFCKPSFQNALCPVIVSYSCLTVLHKLGGLKNNRNLFSPWFAGWMSEIKGASRVVFSVKALQGVGGPFLSPSELLEAAGHLGIPWLAEASLQSLLLSSHDVQPACLGPDFPLLNKDTNYIGFWAHPNPV